MRTLVMLPGMDGSATMFRPLVETTPADVDAVAVSYPPGAANTYRDLLPCVQEALPGDRPFYLLGWSFSGPLALMAAAANPPLLRGVILVCSFARRPISLLPGWARHLARPVLFRSFLALSGARGLLGRRAQPELATLLAQAQSRAGPAALACRARAALAIDVTPELLRCPVPVLYLRATRDRVIRPGCAEHIQRVSAATTIVDIAGPHLALVTNPTASWSALRQFMDRVEGT